MIHFVNFIIFSNLIENEIILNDGTCEDVEEMEVGQYPLNAEFVVDESIFLSTIFYHLNIKSL